MNCLPEHPGQKKERREFSGYQYVVSGGVASGTTINAGTLELTSGASTGAGGVTFATSGGGTLRLDDSVHFGGLIAGFGEPEHLDLSDIAFGANTQLSFVEAGNNTSGTLTVSDGTHTAKLALLGQYVTGNFTMSGAPGTFATYRRIIIRCWAAKRSW